MTTRVGFETHETAKGLLLRRRFVVRGIVQGVGFRPFVARLARDLALTGHCGNDQASVFIEAEGSPEALDELAKRLSSEAPPMAVVVDIETEDLQPRGYAEFTIVPSQAQPGARTLIAPDVATCTDCLAELNDPSDRRYRHPFITCTNCGPRFTIITGLPYDRPATTMVDFPMCEACKAEYGETTDRRFHAQPISCHTCGPRIWLEVDGRRTVGDDAVLREVQLALATGGTIAVKGIGGFHLVCDATNAAAVTRLRQRKHRPAKPFAVMAPDEVAVAEIASLSDAEARVLTGRARPIVLLAKLPKAVVAEAVAPGLDEVGVMLPYAPLHHLLFTQVPGSDVLPPRLLVMTSGNLSDEPLCFSNEDARGRLTSIADAFLMHDRKIAVPCEDSVVAVVGDAELPVRRSRGYAPLPVSLPEPGPVTLAVGAEVKNTFCLTRQDFAFCSAHLGDMGTMESQEAFVRSVEQLNELHDVRPELLVADNHPGYATRRWAEDQSERTGIPLVTVQHHHAHVASLLAEHGRIGTEVIGVAFDGTGYGCDRQVWGGEFLHVSSNIDEFERVGHLEQFDLAGGDVAVRNPFRVALALLRGAGLDDGHWQPSDVSPAECAAVRSQLKSGVGCVATTSVGRLFDGVAALLGVRSRVSYEAQAAIELEALARTAGQEVRLEMELHGGVLALTSLMTGLVDGLREGRPVPGLALGFHRALARAAAAGVIELAHGRGISTVGLTGGVFQNRILLTEMSNLLRAAGLELLMHRVVPPNDGGLSLGQAVVGHATTKRQLVEGRV